MAHLRAAVLYVVDLSEQCGYTLEQQAALFHSIKPLFANKPVLIVGNKTDARPYEALTAEQQKLLHEMESEALRLSHGGVVMSGGAGSSEQSLIFMSTLKEENIHAVRNLACDRLLSMREQVKVTSKRVASIANRLHVAVPKPRDNVARPPCIPVSVLAARAAAAVAATAATASAEAAPLTEKDLQERHGGAGVYSADLRKGYMLEDDGWKYDIMPEILDGHNVADFVDPDIDARLAELELEEAELEVCLIFEFARILVPFLYPSSVGNILYVGWG
jgi:nucleolar GTP-binding protein